MRSHLMPTGYQDEKCAHYLWPIQKPVTILLKFHGSFSTIYHIRQRWYNTCDRASKICNKKKLIL